MANNTFSPSKVTLARATGQAKLDARKQQNAEIRATMGLEGNKITKLKPLSEERMAKIAAFHANRLTSRK